MPAILCAASSWTSARQAAIEAFQARFGPVRDDLGEKMTQLLMEFLHEATEERKKKEPVHT
jgi:hypothetical protein